MHFITISIFLGQYSTVKTKCRNPHLLGSRVRKAGMCMDGQYDLPPTDLLTVYDHSELKPTEGKMINVKGA